MGIRICYLDWLEKTYFSYGRDFSKKGVGGKEEEARYSTFMKAWRGNAPPLRTLALSSLNLVYY